MRKTNAIQKMKERGIKRKMKSYIGTEKRRECQCW